MARINQTQIFEELQLIRKTVERFKFGATLEMIMSELSIDIELRTLQRRLNKLIVDGHILTSGKTKARLYHFNSSAAVVNADYRGRYNVEGWGMLVEEERATYISDGRGGYSIPLSEEGIAIKKMLTQPMAMRSPVGYQRDFLLSYRPNIDSYLTEEDKRKLARLGTTTSLDQPEGTYAKEILQRLLIDLSWNSSRLEGNSYSLLDTQQLIAQGRFADEKSIRDAQMILNHKDAIEFIVQATEDIGYNRYTITNLHAILSINLLSSSKSRGRLRTFAVGIGRSVFTPLGIPQEIEEMFEIILEKASMINDPFEQSFFVMVHLPYLQPFEDVNKRVSRLAANLSLNKHNLAPLAFVDVPHDMYILGTLGVYELNRVELLKDVYIWAYERSAFRYAALRQTLGEPDPFRVKYRSDIRRIVTRIIADAVPPEEAGKLIAKKADYLPEMDREKFIEMVDTELLSLHDGNFATYYVRPAEFRNWKVLWERE